MIGNVCSHDFVCSCFLQDAFLHKRTEIEPTCSPLHSTSMPNIIIRSHPLNPRHLATLESRDESEDVNPAPLTAEEWVEDEDQLADNESVTSGNEHVAPNACPSPLPVSLPVEIPRPASSRPNSLDLGHPNSFPIRRREVRTDSPSTTSSTTVGLIGLGAIFGFALYSFLSGK